MIWILAGLLGGLQGLMWSALFDTTTASVISFFGGVLICVVMLGAMSE